MELFSPGIPSQCRNRLNVKRKKRNSLFYIAKFNTAGQECVQASFQPPSFSTNMEAAMLGRKACRKQVSTDCFYFPFQDLSACVKKKIKVRRDIRVKCNVVLRNAV